MKKWVLLALLLSLSSVSYAQYNIYANDGTFLGNTGNQFDPNSINNQFGKYGSQFSPNSINNQFGQYGSQFSPSSPNNQFSQPGTIVPQYGGYPQQFGGYSRGW